MVIRALRDFLDRAAQGAPESPEEGEHSLHLATAALLFEVVRADGRVDEAERAVMRAALQNTFGLAADELDDLLRDAEASSRRAVSLYEFTQVVDTSFSPEQKKRVVELLWQVAFSDSEKHALEEHLIRTIAGLLHVSHPEFIDAKIRARAAREAGSTS